MAAPLTRTTDPDASPRISARAGAGTGIYFGEIDRLDHNRMFAGRNWRGRPGVLGKSAEMLTDAHVSSARDAVIDLVSGSHFGFDPGAETDAAREAAKFAEYVWFERYPFRRYLHRKLRNTFSYGFDLHEQVERRSSFPGDRFPGLMARTDQAVILAELRDIQARTVEAWVPGRRDPTKVRSVTQSILHSDAEDPREVSIPGDRLIRSTWRQEGANFEGAAPQRLAAGPWYVKRLLRKIQLLAHNKHHVGVPVIEQSDTPAEQDDRVAVSQVQKWQANERAAVLLPSGYKLTLLNTNPGTAIQETIDALNFEILHAQGFGHLLHGSGSSNTHGSYGLAGVQDAHATARLDAWGEFAEETHNFGFDGWGPVERLHVLNYGTEVPCPILRVRHMPTVRFDKILPLVFNGITAGVISPDQDLEDFVRMVLKLSQRMPEIRDFASDAADEARRLRENGSPDDA